MSPLAMEDIMPSWVLESPIARDLVHLAVIFVVAVLVYVVARWWLVAGIRRLVKRSRVSWDDALVDARVFVRLETGHGRPSRTAFLIWSIRRGFKIRSAHRGSVAMRPCGRLDSASADAASQGTAPSSPPGLEGP